MIYLSESALKYAANICEELPGYKVGIATSALPLLVALKFFYTAIAKDRDTIEVIENKKRDCATIEFSNGSTIQFISASEKSRGYAFNLLIVEYGIDKEFVSCVLRPCEKVDYYLNHLRGQDEC